MIIDTYKRAVGVLTVEAAREGLAGLPAGYAAQQRALGAEVPREKEARVQIEREAFEAGQRAEAQGG